MSPRLEAPSDVYCGQTRPTLRPTLSHVCPNNVCNSHRQKEKDAEYTSGCALGRLLEEFPFRLSLGVTNARSRLLGALSSGPNVQRPSHQRTIKIGRINTNLLHFFAFSHLLIQLSCAMFLFLLARTLRLVTSCPFKTKPSPSQRCPMPTGQVPDIPERERLRRKSQCVRASTTSRERKKANSNWGLKVGGVAKEDAPAASGMIQRQGLGKVRHTEHCVCVLRSGNDSVQDRGGLESWDWTTLHCPSVLFDPPQVFPDHPLKEGPQDCGVTSGPVEAPKCLIEGKRFQTQCMTSANRRRRKVDAEEAGETGGRK